jgi:mannose/cellobiose epimerase-like protein (N-acyl-D-glucosamine 2-epimerase family)
MKNKDYSRRNFLKINTLTGTGVLLFGGLGCGTQTSSFAKKSESKGNLSDLKLEELQKRYHSDLFEHFVPNMDKYVIDHELGGFMCSVEIESGKLTSTNKRSWYEGRGMWTYSFLYNNLDKKPEYLEIARKSKDFILKSQPKGNKFWPTSFTREGKRESTDGKLEEEGDIYSSLFVAEGLAEFAKASGESKYRDLAKQILFSCLDRYDSPDYTYKVSYLSREAPEVPAPRVLGHWMVFLRSATQMLENAPDPEIEKLAARCVDAILNFHLNPDYKLVNELLNHDLTRPNNEFNQFSYTGHGIETIWMLLFEAARRKDKALFDRSVDIFKRHVTVAKDTVYGGYFRSLDHVDNNKWKVDKVLWLQEEVLIGTLFIAEHTGDLWAKQCFNETLEYVNRNFRRPGFKFWLSGGDRKLVEYNKVRAEHYHHPRHLMLNLLALNRIIRNKGEVSSLFS